MGNCALLFLDLVQCVNVRMCVFACAIRNGKVICDCKSVDDLLSVTFSNQFDIISELLG